jgi:putative RecB family exonuclease
MPSLSPSRANDFQRCPLLYRFRALDRLPEEPGLAALRGTLVHLVLEALFDLPRAERLPQTGIGLIPKAFERLRQREAHLDKLLAADGAREAWLAEVEELVRAYFTLEDPTRLIPQARELLVSAQLNDELTLRGYIDRLDVAPGSGLIRVVDYKSGRSPAPAYAGEALFQVRFYALVVWLTRGTIPAMVQLIYLGDKQVLRSEPTQGDLERVKLKIETLWRSIQNMIRAREFPPVKGPLCRWCYFQSLCPEFGGEPPPFPDLSQSA